MKKIKKINANTCEQLLPASYRPLSPWSYFWRSVLYSIPVVGWLVLLIHVFACKSRHGRSYARFHLLVAIVIAAVAYASQFLMGVALPF